MTLVFVGGAIGSVLGTLVYHSGDWPAAAACGAGIGLLALVLNVIERSTRAA
jgi:predicted MFS family arabinose efflux permease